MIKNRSIFKYLLCIPVFFILGNFQVQSQEKKPKKIVITGTITDFNDEPLRGVYIYVDSLQTNVRTNKKGMYKLKTNDDLTMITVYSPEHGLMSTSYSGEKKISFKYSKDSKPLTQDEVLDLGYYKPIRSNGRIVNFEGTRSMNGFNNIYQLIEGTVAGVTVTGNKISIRGADSSSTSPGNETQPLFMVNNVAMYDISNIPPNQVKSIEVIKGPEAAYYGAKGVHGVIKINLKEE